MKYFSIVISLMLLTLIAKAASPEDETNFLNAVSDAFTKKDVSAVIALTCWDKIPNARNKAWLTNFYSFDSGEEIACGAMYIDLKNTMALIKSTNKDFVYNLPVTKCIRIEHCPIKPFQNEYAESWQELAVGEKDGKLMIAMKIRKP